MAKINRKARRRERLKMLIIEAGGKNTILAEITGFTPNHIGVMKNGKSAIGTDVAERLEAAMGKPDGWMDQWLPTEGGWAQPARNQYWHLSRMIEELPTDVSKAIRDGIIAAYRQLPKPQTKKRGKKTV